MDARISQFSPTRIIRYLHVFGSSYVLGQSALDHRSRRVRLFIALNLLAFTLISLANFGLTVSSFFVAIHDWSPHKVSTPSEIFLLAVPRIVMILASLTSVTLFCIPLLWYRLEPTLHLSDFMQEVEYPTVDVFLPRYKEDWPLYGPTVHATLALDYPKDKFTVHILDDGARLDPILPHLEDLMPQHPNLRYVTRPDGKDGKAGNLNHALHPSRSIGTLIVVFDADHSCKPEFLLRTIPHLLSVVDGRRLPTLSDRTAFVQTTQAFYNENLPLVRLLDGSQALFYRLLLPSFGGLGCAFCVGTGYVMQRAALDSVGGYVGGCVVEDITTSFALHKRGWTSKFLECRLSEGLSPATLSEFFSQRERWVAGSAQLLFYNGMSTATGIPFIYLLAYLTGSWYWLSAIGFLFLAIVRIILSLIYSSVTGEKTKMWIPVLSEYFPVYIIFLLMPVLSFPGKIACIFTIFTFVPTYLSVLYNLVAGRLNPIRRGAFRILTACEAFGDAWPRLANLNVAILATASLSFGISTIPAFRVSKAPLDWIASGSFVGWLYLVNAPIFYDLGRRVFRFCALVHQRFRSRSKLDAV